MWVEAAGATRQARRVPHPTLLGTGAAFLSAAPHRPSVRRRSLRPVRGKSNRPTTFLLTITAGNEGTHAFAIQGSAGGFEALDRCIVDLLKSWGMDEEAQAAIASKPEAVPNPSVHIRNSDYPVAVVRNGEQGTSGVRFWVGVDGRPRDCRVIEPSGSALLDATTCRLLTRARFKPAITYDARTVPSLSFTRVRWVLPDQGRDARAEA